MFNFIPNPFSFLPQSLFLGSSHIINSHSAGDFQHPLGNRVGQVTVLAKDMIGSHMCNLQQLLLQNLPHIPFPHLSISQNATWLRQLLSVLLSQQQSLGAEGATGRKPSGSWRSFLTSYLPTELRLFPWNTRISSMLTSVIFLVCFHHSSSVFALPNITPGMEDEDPIRGAATKGGWL